MKRIISNLTIVMLFLTSCHQDELIIRAPAELIGSWEWIITYKGYAPGPMNPLTPQKTGNTEQIEFGEDFTWKSYINNIPQDSGTYITGQGTYSPSQYTVYTFDSIQYYRNGEMIKGMVNYYEVHHDTLIFAGIFRGLYGSDSKLYVINKDGI